MLHSTVAAPGVRHYLALALTMAMSAAPVLAGPGDVNSVNDGQNVQHGTYYNTPGQRTVFQNSAGTGLIVGAGGTVTGLEVGNPANPAGSLTGNGGWLHFNAPGQVVRIDGNVDVSGIMKGGVLGNGGRVTVNSAFLYQNGHIYANGRNAGTVQFNVGSMVMGPTARIEATSLTGNGGRVDINATGVVDISPGALIDTSGKVIGSFNSNVITIKGGLINLDGILTADGLAGERGGEIMLVSNGNSTPLNIVAANEAEALFAPGEIDFLVDNDSQLIAAYENDIHIGSDGRVFANGGDGIDSATPRDGGDGGYIRINAKLDIHNEGIIQADGGKGGDNTRLVVGPVTYDAYGKPVQTSVGEPGAKGGDGGRIDLYYDPLFNSGFINARGGQGGRGSDAYSGTSGVAYADRHAQGGPGGPGGNGGFIGLWGAEEPSLINISVEGGQGGPGGNGITYAYTIPGCQGVPGMDGRIVYYPVPKPPGPPVTPPPVTPPPGTPTTETPPPVVPPFVPPVIPPGGATPPPTPIGPIVLVNDIVPAPVVAVLPERIPPVAQYQQLVPPPVSPTVVEQPVMEIRSAVRGYW